MSGVIGLDRFCDECGYNLRTQPVVREPRTGIAVVRCPECGRFHAANEGSALRRVWLDRIAFVLLCAWVIMLAALLFHAGLAMGALSYGTLEELTSSGGTVITRRVGNTVTRTWTAGSGTVQVQTNMEHAGLFLALVLSVSLLVSFAFGMLATVACPHWPRGGYAALVLALPLAAGLVVAALWHHEAPHLFGWGLAYIGAHFGLQLSGGVVGVRCGRALARVVVRVTLPPTLRQRLSYLWLVDHKPFPTTTPNTDK